jgi:hypothetical protein
MMFEENRFSIDLAEPWEDEASGNEGNCAHPGRSGADTGPQKIFLPRGSAETRFAPRQYYYLASNTGVVPSWAVVTPSVVSPSQ